MDPPDWEERDSHLESVMSHSSTIHSRDRVSKDNVFVPIANLEPGGCHKYNDVSTMAGF